MKQFNTKTAILTSLIMAATLIPTAWAFDVDPHRMSLEPSTINVSDEMGKTKLHEAARQGCAEIVKQLLKAGAQVDARDQKNNTSLHWAAGGCSAGTVKALLNAGAAIHACNRHNNTPLHLAALGRSFVNVKQLLEAGAAANVINIDGDTPLHLAAQSGCLAVVRELVKNKHVEVNVFNYAGNASRLREREVSSGCSYVFRKKSAALGKPAFSNAVFRRNDPTLLKVGHGDDITDQVYLVE